MHDCKRYLLALAVALAALAIACDGGGDGGDSDANATASETIVAPTSPNVDLDLCNAMPEVLGTIPSPELVEVSGIETSRTNPDVIWAHNDSGDTPRVFALARDGTLLATYTLAGAEAMDWEDMAIGPGPEEGKTYLYLADIGDNQAIRPEVAIYRVPEPEVDPATALAPPTVELQGVERLAFRYPDTSHDAEALLVDPQRGELYIMTKDLQLPASSIYRASTAVEPDGAVTLDMVAQYDFTQLNSRVELAPDAPELPHSLPDLVTGADVSPDGGLIVVRTYSTVWLWRRPSAAPLLDAFREEPCEGPSTLEAQGEAIAIDADGGGYITIGEGANPPINHFAAP